MTTKTFLWSWATQLD